MNIYNNRYINSLNMNRIIQVTVDAVILLRKIILRIMYHTCRKRSTLSHLPFELFNSTKAIE